MDYATKKQDSPSKAPEISEGKKAYNCARNTALCMILLFTVGLVLSVLSTVKKVKDVQMSTPWATVWESHGAYVVLVGISGGSIVVWLMILIGISACWTGGCIFERKARKVKEAGAGAGAKMEQQQELPRWDGDSVVDMERVGDTRFESDELRGFVDGQGRRGEMR